MQKWLMAQRWFVDEVKKLHILFSPGT